MLNVNLFFFVSKSKRLSILQFTALLVFSAVEILAVHMCHFAQCKKGIYHMFEKYY